MFDHLHLPEMLRTHKNRTFSTKEQKNTPTLANSCSNNYFCHIYYQFRPLSFSVYIIMSHSLLWRHIVLLTVGVYIPLESV